MSGEGEGPSAESKDGAGGEHQPDHKAAKHKRKFQKALFEWSNHGLTLAAVIVSGLAVYVSYLANETSAEANNAAFQANELTRTQMQEEMRPWVSVQSAVGLVRQINTEGAVIGVKHRFLNHGRYPAVRGQLAIGLLAINQKVNEQEGNSYEKIVRQEVDAACRETEKPGRNYGSHPQSVVFPGVETAAVGDPERGAREIGFAADETDKHALLAAIGCLRYESPSGEVGFTTFAYDVYLISCADYPSGEDRAENIDGFRPIMLGPTQNHWSYHGDVCLVPTPGISSVS
jgi:hypothetical protein